MNKSKDLVKARKPFRILAGIIAGLCVFNIFSNIQMIRLGYWDNIAGLLISIIFMLEFGAIALRGDGLFLYRSDRFNKNR